MATHYVWSGATGTGDGSSWANAYTTLLAAIAAGAGGDTYYLADDHFETSAATFSINAKGTLGTPDIFLCVKRVGGSVPPVAADLVNANAGTGCAIIQTTAGTLNVNGFYYARGLYIRSGQGSTGSASVGIGGGANGSFNVLERCLLEVATTNASSFLTLGNGNAETHLMNVTVSWNGQFQGITLGNNLYWHNDAGVPAALNAGTFYAFFRVANGHYAELSGLDLSAFASIFDGNGGNGWQPIVHMENCKIQASPAFHPQFFGFWDMIGCDVGGDIAHNERHDQCGALTTEEVVVRASGAAINGTSFSWKLASTAVCNEPQFFETFEIEVECLVVGSPKTFTLHTLTDGVTLDNSKVWVHLEYLGTAGATISSIASSHRPTILDAAVNYTGESAAGWVTTGLAAPVAQKMAVTFTPQKAGLVRAVVRVGAPSLTMWVDPQPDLA